MKGQSTWDCVERVVGGSAEAMINSGPIHYILSLGACLVQSEDSNTPVLVLHYSFWFWHQLWRTWLEFVIHSYLVMSLFLNERSESLPSPCISWSSPFPGSLTGTNHRRRNAASPESALWDRARAFGCRWWDKLRVSIQRPLPLLLNLLFLHVLHHQDHLREMEMDLRTPSSKHRPQSYEKLHAKAPTCTARRLRSRWSRVSPLVDGLFKSPLRSSG